MRIITEQNTYLSLKDEYGKIRNEQIFIVAESGWGKSLFAESIAEQYHKAGYIVIVLADPKNEVEYGFAQFKPQAPYHVKTLKKEGKVAERQKIKLYHPFTFRIPKKNIPNYNFYTFNIKTLGQKEWSLLAETPSETETIRVLKKACSDIKKDIGIYGFLHYMQDRIKGKKENKTLKADSKNFYLSVTSGTAKSIQDIANYIQPFKKDYFLAKASGKLNLNWKEILRDNKHYHVFVSNYMPRSEDKLKSFIIMTLFNQILENKEYATRPILIVIPEVRYLTPFKPKGYKVFLSEAIKENLSVMRSMGKGMSSLLDTQVFSGVDEEVINSATTTFYGEIGGARDLDKICKSMNYKRSIRELLAKMDAPNSYIIQGMEDIGSNRAWFPSHMHCEPNYNFTETCMKLDPGQMKNYSELIQEMKSDLKEEENKIKAKVKKKEKREKKRKEELEKLKEEAKKEKEGSKKKEKKIS